MEPHVREAKVQDAYQLLPTLRKADQQECHAYLGMSPRIVLPVTVRASSKDTWAMIGEQGECVGLFGVQPVFGVDQMGMAWLMASDHLVQNNYYKFKFLKESRTWLNLLLDKYPILGNYVDERNELHLRWLKWLGFSVIKRMERFGYEQRPFLQVIKVKT